MRVLIAQKRNSNKFEYHKLIMETMQISSLLLWQECCPKFVLKS